MVGCVHGPPLLVLKDTLLRDASEDVLLLGPLRSLPCIFQLWHSCQISYAVLGDASFRLVITL